MTILELMQQHAANPVLRERVKPQWIEHTSGARAAIRVVGGAGWYTRGPNALPAYQDIINNDLHLSNEWSLIGPVQNFAGGEEGGN